MRSCRCLQTPVKKIKNYFTLVMNYFPCLILIFSHNLQCMAETKEIMIFNGSHAVGQYGCTRQIYNLLNDRCIPYLTLSGSLFCGNYDAKLNPNWTFKEKKSNVAEIKISSLCQIEVRVHMEIRPMNEILIYLCRLRLSWEGVGRFSPCRFLDFLQEKILHP